MIICYFPVDKQLNISKDTIIALVLAKAPGVAVEFKFLRCRYDLIFQVGGVNERKWFLSQIHKTLLENTTRSLFNNYMWWRSPYTSSRVSVQCIALSIMYFTWWLKPSGTCGQKMCWVIWHVFCILLHWTHVMHYNELYTANYSPVTAECTSFP